MMMVMTDISKILLLRMVMKRFRQAVAVVVMVRCSLNLNLRGWIYDLLI